MWRLTNKSKINELLVFSLILFYKLEISLHNLNFKKAFKGFKKAFRNISATDLERSFPPKIFQGKSNLHIKLIVCSLEKRKYSNSKLFRTVNCGKKYIRFLELFASNVLDKVFLFKSIERVDQLSQTHESCYRFLRTPAC